MKKFSAAFAGSAMIAAGLLAGSLTAAGPATATPSLKEQMATWECGLPKDTGFPTGRVYQDLNRNNKADRGEKGVEGAVVFITWPEGYGTVMTSAKTDQDGLWRSDRLSPKGYYEIHVASPTGLPDGWKAPSGQPRAFFDPSPVQASDDVVSCGGNTKLADWSIALLADSNVQEQLSPASPASPVSSPYTHVLKDVPKTHTYARPIAWMLDEGLTTTYKDGTFRPDQPVTRGELAQILHEMAGEK